MPPYPFFLLFLMMMGGFQPFSGVQALWLHPNNGQPITFYQTPRVQCVGLATTYPNGGYNVHPVEGILRKSTSVSGSELNGTVIFLDHPRPLHYAQILPKYNNSGVAAILLTNMAKTSSPGSLSWASPSFADAPQHLDFPVFELIQSTNQSLNQWISNQTGDIYITIGEDLNDWELTYTRALPAIGYYILIFNGVIMVIGTYKLCVTLSVQGLRLNVPQMVLLMNVIGCLIRCAWAAGDPFGVYGVAHPLWVQIGWTLPTTFVVGGCLMIALYWHEILRKNGTKINQFLNSMKWPFVVAFSISLAVELACGILRGEAAVNASALLLINALIYVFFLIVFIIFFVVTRIRLQKVFDKLNQNLHASHKGQKLKIATRTITGITCVMIVWIVLALLIGASPLLFTPVGFPVLWFIFFSSLMLMSLLQVILIRCPYRSWRWIFLGLCVDISGEEIGADTYKFGSRTARSTGSSQNSTSSAV